MCSSVRNSRLKLIELELELQRSQQQDTFIMFEFFGKNVKTDVFHMLSGMWKMPAEKCFMWLEGFHSSELLKFLETHLEPLVGQQLMAISKETGDTLSQGIKALQQSLLNTLSNTCLGPTVSGNIGDNIGNKQPTISDIVLFTEKLKPSAAKSKMLNNLIHIFGLLS
ncbi:hypothetical protein V6N12_014386 [Hibiscus sabdariffa]|uniref:DOG1 domain-containing protein n=1 Tax=Hibiscus sabdariffa TaxID=183260 RepID=A0ABR2DL48_9ROSI